jgi:zinc transport system substrate-binding protein
MKKSLIALTITVMLIFTGTSCINGEKEKNENEKIKVITTILPIKHFVEKVGGDKVEVELLIPPGSEPHTYELTPRQLVGISDADLYVKAGQIEFEKANLDKIKEQNEDMLMVNGSEGVELRELESHSHEHGNEHEEDAHGESDEDEYKEDTNDVNHEEDEKQSHEEEGNEEGGEKDPHTWLSIENANIYVENIYEALVEVDPNNKDYYYENKEQYIKELDELGDELKETLKEESGRKIIVYHPAFGYLLDDYNIEQLPIEIEGKEPTAKQLEELIEEALEENVKTIFVQKQFSAKSAEALAEEIDGVVVQIDPLAENFIENLRGIAKELKKK